MLNRIRWYAVEIATWIVAAGLVFFFLAGLALSVLWRTLDPRLPDD